MKKKALEPILSILSLVLLVVHLLCYVVVLLGFFPFYILLVMTLDGLLITTKQEYKECKYLDLVCNDIKDYVGRINYFISGGRIF